MGEGNLSLTRPSGEGSESPPAPELEVPPRRVPWVTITACVVMVALFGVALLTPNTMPFASFGYRGDAFQVWSGAVWVLLVSAFMHLALWHVALNVYWLWILGRVIEKAFGPVVLGLLLLTSAFVGSAFQLAIFDNVGVGSSGMVFALFGFGWLAKGKNAALKAVLTPKVGTLFVAWLVACWIVLTRLVGNGAHLGGLLFGAVAAEAFATGRWPRLAKTIAGLVLVLSLAVSFVCPWSAIWWSTAGYKVQTAGRYDAAIEAYGMSLELRPDQPWVMANLVRAYRAAGKGEEAASLLAKLKSISPNEAAKLAGE
jgi:GlpG protein